MPFGLTNAPAVFQTLINNALWDMLNCFVFIYLDIQEYIQHVKLVLQCFLEKQLLVKAENVSSMLLRWPFWSCPYQGSSRLAHSYIKKATPMFSRICCYCIFIRDYSEVATPLTKLAFIKLPFMVLRRRGSICQAKTIFPKLQFSPTLTSLFNLW